MPANTTEIEKRLWDAADDLRAKCEAVYQHVYDSYYGAGGSVYALAT